MNTKVYACNSSSVKTILIVLIVLALAIISTHSQVQGQIGGNDASLPKSDTSAQAVVTGDGIVDGGPGFVMVSPFDFRPYSAADQWQYMNTGLINPSLANESVLVAGLTLPHKASITKLTLYYKDNYAPNNMVVSLVRGLGNGAAETMASFTTQGEMTAFRYDSVSLIITPVADNQTFSYFLLLRIPPNAGEKLMLTNVRIDYEYTVYTPTIMK